MAGRASKLPLLFIAALVVACGSPAPSASGSVAGATGVITSLHKGSFDPHALSADLTSPPFSADNLSAGAAALGTSDRAQINAAGAFGPSVTQLQDLMDQTEKAVLQQLQAKMTGASGTSWIPARLVSYRGPSATAGPLANTVLLTVSFLLMIGMGTAAVAAFDPRVDMPSVPQTVDQNSSSGPASVSIHSTVTLSSVGGQLSVAISMSGSGTTTDAATGAIRTMTGSTNYSISFNPCPNPSGGVQGHIDIEDDEAFTGGGKTVGYSYQGSSDFLTQVDDQANIETTAVDTNMDRSVTTWSATSGSDVTTQLAMTASDTYDANGTADPAASSWTVDESSGEVTVDDGKELGKAIGLFGEGAALFFSMRARDVWRSGKCFDVRPVPDGGNVSTGSKTSVKVSVYHWVDKADTKVPVTATLAGTASIDPNNQPVDSPAQFQFTAGAPGSTGTVTYKVTSDRGIGQKESTFKVNADLKVDIAGTLLETGGPASYNLKVSASGIVLHIAPDGSITASGQAAVTGSASALGGVCRGTINEKIDVQGTGTVTGPPDAPVYRVLIGPASTSSLGGTFSCPGVSVKSNQGDFFGQWSSTIGPVDFPAAGGTFSKSGTSSVGGLLNRQAAGTYTVTPA